MEVELEEVYVELELQSEGGCGRGEKVAELKFYEELEEMKLYKVEQEVEL